MRMKRSSIAITAALGLAVAGGSAFTAGNTGTPLTSAGFETTTADGFTVSNVDYQLGSNAAPGTTADDVDAVQLDLDPLDDLNLPAAQVRVRLVSTGLYYECDDVTVGGTGAAGELTTWNCDTTGLDVLTIDALDVVAVSQDDIA